MLLFGGSFDPVHLGHLIVSRAVAERLGIERIMLVPSARPPHKQDRALAPAAERLALCRLAVEGDPLFDVSDWELRQAGVSYTLETVRHFRAGLPAGSGLYWLVGMDSLMELGTWYRAGELVEACTIVTAVRPGYEDPDLARLRAVLRPDQIDKLARHIVPTPRIDISSTEIRARLAAGRSIRFLVPEPVRRYIAEHRLYQASM
jgi:nicotinate-nucleotide adenylyltransferase